MRRRVVLASRNPGKLRELREILSPSGFQPLSIAEFSSATVAETAVTFVENSLIKARHAARVSGLPALADDSGLVVDALGGAPGVRSARYAGLQATDEENNQRLLKDLAQMPLDNRGARFVCTLVFLLSENDPQPLVFSGIWHGSIVQTPRGSGGFGYDPLFLDEASGLTAAQLSAPEKAAVSHRGSALRQLVAALSTGPDWPMSPSP